MKTLPDILVMDTCVLLSNVLRRLFLRLASQGCFAPAWSPIIGDEWRRNAARIWSATPEDIQEQWAALQAEFPHADQGDVDPFKAGLERSDPKDWHVIAAGLAAQAASPDKSVAIVTRNIRDFNRTELRRRGLNVFDPDQCLLMFAQRAPELVRAMLDRIPGDFIEVGRAVEPIGAVLKRERLFRLSRLYADSLVEGT